MSMTFLFEKGRRPLRGALLILAALGGACQPDMRHQDRAKSQGYSRSFPDHRQARLPVSGTVSRQENDLVAKDNHGGLAPYMPRPFKRDQLETGQNAFQVFCVPCHGYTGYGDGMVVKHGVPQPTSLHDMRLLAANDAHFYAVITEGAGAMPSYGKQISRSERWAIVAYIRALQLSQNVPACDLPGDVKRRLNVGPCGPGDKPWP